jgi:tetratricopeptide (TPR) repeat protein
VNWQDVQTLRKAGQLKEAHDAASAILAADPADFKTKSQYEWVIFDYIKRIVGDIDAALAKSQPIRSRDVDELMEWMREYYRLKPRIPEMVCSNILGQIVKVGAHLPKFPDITSWIGIDGLRSEDWQSNEYQGTTYPSLATKIARALCKWAKTHPDASSEQVGVALEWAERARETAEGDDLLWLNWDMAILLRQIGEFHRAAELLAAVVKAKRNEFWVWAEAGRLYRSEQPELALACFCRALECPAESKFLVRAHRELAELLAEQEEYAQASREVAITIDIRQAEGWSVGREMEALIASPWYDPSAEGSEDPQDFYAQHSASALALCFDVVETKAASYLGLLIPHTPNEPRPDRKPKPLSRFAIKDTNGRAWTLVGPGMKKQKFEVGAPLSVVIGRQNGEDRQTIVHVSARHEGEYWDCLEQSGGVVAREANDEIPMKVFVPGIGDEANVDAPTDESLRVGDGVRFSLARNPKNDRLNAFNVERGELPERDVKVVHGQLYRHPKGFAFVDDAFVAPPLVESVDSTIEEVVAVAVYGKHPKEDKRAWRVITLDAV